MEVSVASRIIELKKIIAAEEKYNNFFCGIVTDSKILQDELTTLQLPTIKAIAKLNPSDIDIETNKRSDSLEKVPEQSFQNKIPFIPNIDFKNINPVLTETIKPKIEIVNGFVEITIGKTEIILCEIKLHKYFSVGKNLISYSDDVMNLILGNGTRHSDTIAKEIYLKKLNIIFPSNSNYINILKNKVRFKKPKKPKPIPAREIKSDTEKVKSDTETGTGASGPEYETGTEKETGASDTEGDGLANSIKLFEKLTLLISAVKAGHNNLEYEIKVICKKLLKLNLISKKKYNSYKKKYF